VYADYDPVVLAHARALLTSHEAGATEYIDADLRDTDTILDQAAQLLDFTKPVAVTLLAIVHVIPDSDDPHAIVAKVMDAVPPGSCLAISHAGTDLFDEETNDSFRGVINQMMLQRYTPRSREQVARFFAGHGPGGAGPGAGRGLAAEARHGRCGHVGDIRRGWAASAEIREKPACQPPVAARASRVPLGRLRPA